MSQRLNDFFSSKLCVYNIVTHFHFLVFNIKNFFSQLYKNHLEADVKTATEHKNCKQVP